MRLWSIALLIPCCWLGIGTRTARAQLPLAPNWPIAPTDPSQCAAFAADLDKYQAVVSNQHEECLKAGKADRPNEPSNSSICSRSACQVLHDILFSDYNYTAVKDLRKRVDACYAQVKEYQDRQAAQKREAEEREQADREQAGRDQQSAEKTREKREEDRSQRERTRISPTPASQGAANNPTVIPPSQQTGQPYSVGSMKVPDTPQAEQARQAAKDREQKDLSEQALNEMADPFGKSGKGKSATKSTTASDGVVDPFGNSRDDTAPNNSSSDTQLADPFAQGNSKTAQPYKQVAGHADCDSALQYVSDPNGLQKDLDLAVAQRRIHENGMHLQQKLKADLLKDSWWDASPGPVVAAHIKVACDEFQDWVSVLNPEEAKLEEGKDQLLKFLKVASVTIKAAYDNNESVTAAVKAAEEAEAKELADIAGEELTDALKVGPAWGTYKAFKDNEDYLKTLREAAEARETVQDQIRKLDHQIAQARREVSIDAERQTVLEALQQDVVNACVQKPIEIGKP